MKKNILAKTLNSNSLIEIYRDFLTTESLFCKTMGESMELLCVEKFNNHGEYDGISIIFKSDITRIRIGGVEKKSLSRLIAKQNQPKKHTKIQFRTVKSAIQTVNASFKHITLFLEKMDADVCFIGELQAIDQTSVLLLEYGSTCHGLDRSQILLPLGQITRVEADGKYEKDLLFLHKK